MAMHKGAPPILFHFARENRQQSTRAEKLLWSRVRNRRVSGFKFRRQHPIGDFVADFYCAEKSLVVEIDGNYHSSRDQKEYDEGRTFELKELKVTVIRFSNDEVCGHMEAVVKKIENLLTSL